MKKSFLSILLILTGIITMISFTAYASTDNSCGDNLTWEVTGKKLIIKGTGEMYDYSSDMAPWGWDIATVEIQSGVTSIGENAFEWCDNLTILILPNTVTAIGKSAFTDCRELQYVCYTGNEAGWASLSIEEDNIALMDANKIYGFTDATVIANGTCGDTLTWELDGSGALTITGTGEMETNNRSWEDLSVCISSVKLQNGITSISSHAFENCTDLKSIAIPDSIISIGRYAFATCSSLTNITIGSGVTNISEDAFRHCNSLSNITISEINTAYCSQNGNLFTKDKKTLAQYAIANPASTYTVPDSVTTIGAYAFEGCNTLTTVLLSDHVQTISKYAFANCKKLETITMPKGLTTIGTYAFSDCALKAITIPDNVTVVDSKAFEDCADLKTIVIGSSVTTIGEDAFRHCESLLSISVSQKNPAYYSQDETLLTKDKKTLIQYATANPATTYEIPDTVTHIAPNAFEGCETITKIIIPSSVTHIGDSAFFSCENLTDISISDHTIHIGSHVFWQTAYERDDNNWVDNVLYIGNHLIEADRLSGTYEMKPSTVSIATDAFQSCRNLTSIKLSDSLRAIGEDAFESCSGITTLILPDTVQYIGSGAFRSCESLESILIPDGVISIGDSAFLWCDSLRDIYYKGSKARWNSIVYKDIEFDLESVTIHYRYGDAIVLDFNYKDFSMAIESLSAVSDAVLCTAIYDSRNRLIDIDTRSISLSAGRNTLALPFTNLSNAATLKMILWENATSMKPLCISYTESL